MTLEICKGLWIDLNEIYLMQMDDYIADEMLVFIKLHPRHPIVVKGFDAIDRIEQLMKERHEQLTPDSQNDTRASETILEAFDTGTESAIQPDDGTAR